MKEYWDSQAGSSRMVTSTRPDIVVIGFDNVGGFIEDVKKAGLALDVGVGGGAMVRRLTGIADIEAADISDKVLENVPLDSSKKFLIGSLTAGRYPLAFSHLVFQHCIEPVEFLKTVHRALKEGGIFYMQFNANTPMGIAEGEFLAKKGLLVYTPQEVSKMFESCGFKDIITHYDTLRKWGYIKAVKR